MRRITKHKADAINRLGARLRETLKRCDPPISDSLRLMIAHIAKDALTKSYRGDTEIHPGVAKLAKWGNCGERQARRNLRQMEAWEIVQPVGYLRGGKYATRFWVDLQAIIRLVMFRGANPHADLITEIREHMDVVGVSPIAPARADIRADIEGGHMAGQMSAGYKTTSYIDLHDQLSRHRAGLKPG